ncbi:MAG: ABC transporter ATP-binding protein [Xanthomonadales bacterium]|nr:ABC transporter ATP-binding protein [Xanthomonadales bacterium]MCE7932288.1 ABC transporter ATP-binding protein [Xanthomonadales bacterium PRO6]
MQRAGERDAGAETVPVDRTVVLGVDAHRCENGGVRCYCNCITSAGCKSLVELLSLTGLRFGWRSDQTLLDIDALALASGERLFLRGPSGCGKSTLLGLIGGVLQPRSGSIHLLGQALEALRPAARDRLRADHIGFVFQQFNLLPYLDARDNVLLPLGFSRRRAAAVGSDPRARADELLRRLNLDADALAGQAAAELSFGQQQRVAVARALIGAPELIVADEPTSALDADNRKAFLDLLAKECARSGTALLFVSHDASLADGFDRVLDLPALNRATAPACC